MFLSGRRGSFFTLLVAPFAVRVFHFCVITSVRSFHFYLLSDMPCSGRLSSPWNYTSFIYFFSSAFVVQWFIFRYGIHLEFVMYVAGGRDQTPFSKWEASTRLLKIVSFPLHFEDATSYTICPHSHLSVSGLKRINSTLCLSRNQHDSHRYAVSQSRNQTHFLARNSPSKLRRLPHPSHLLHLRLIFFLPLCAALCYPWNISHVNRSDSPNQRGHVW